MDAADRAVNIQNSDGDSGSAYEESSSDADVNSQDERPSNSRLSSQKQRGRSRSVKAGDRIQHGDEPDSSLGSGASPQADLDIDVVDAVEWAAKFQAPHSPGDIKSPTRHTAGAQSKRKADLPPSEIRAKRLKAFYSNEYRELLNAEIHEATARNGPYDYASVPRSQIGSSIWTGPEKNAFFSALSRLGRHDVQGIASQVESKSEVEVQEYIQVLCQGLKGKENEQQRHLDFTELSAAFEISDECCGLLERAGDVLASRQECSEEQKENAKWGDFWLLTTEVSKSIERQRRDDGGEGIEKQLPAANLFNLKNWLELSQGVFMNPGESRRGENWQTFAEPGEAPAIRATAFEDLHSLAVSITKRIISATLFCAMSRRRATNSIRAKRAEVNRDDVEAAVRMLDLKESSEEFWIGSARRLHLKVFDEDEDTGKRTNLTYDEMETTLRQEIRRRSRSRSRSFAPPESSRPTSSVGTEADREGLTNSSSGSEPLEEQDSDSMSDSSLEDEDFKEESDGDGHSRSSRLAKRKEKKAEQTRETELAEDAYLAVFDNAADQMEEERLWALLGQTAPFDIKPEPLAILDRPKNRRKEEVEVDWRDNIEYWSPWETLETLVPEESFVKNRKRGRSAGVGGKKAKRGRSDTATSYLGDEDEDSELLSVESEGSVHSGIEEQESPPYRGEEDGGSSEEYEEAEDALNEDDDTLDIPS